jgi:hypothetical protein
LKRRWTGAEVVAQDGQHFSVRNFISDLPRIKVGIHDAGCDQAIDLSIRPLIGIKGKPDSFQQ